MIKFNLEFEEKNKAALLKCPPMVNEQVIVIKDLELI